jgi:hypothetical protein
MNTETPKVSDPAALARARPVLRMLLCAAAGLVLLGVLVMFLPALGRAPLREIMAVYAVFLRRRLR